MIKLLFFVGFISQNFNTFVLFLIKSKAEFIVLDVDVALRSCDGETCVNGGTHWCAHVDAIWLVTEMSHQDMSSDCFHSHSSLYFYLFRFGWFFMMQLCFSWLSHNQQQTITRDERIYIYLLIIINCLCFYVCYSNNFSSLLRVSSFLDKRHWDTSLMFWACSAFFHVHWAHYHERRPLQLSWMGGEGYRDTKQQLNTF